MATKYTVIQYFPDPISDERVNVGVVAVDERGAFSRFLRNWKRVRQFAPGGIEFLKDFAERVEYATSANYPLPGIDPSRHASAEWVLEIAGKWRRSIQLTAPRTSVRPAEELIEAMAARFLTEPRARASRGKDRRVAARAAVNGITEVVKSRGPELAERFVKKRHEVAGKLGNHVFDAVVQNGRIYCAAQGLSFQIGADTLKREIDATAWAIDDLRQRFPEVPVAVVVIPPEKATRLYTDARYIFEGLDATVLKENRVEKWAHEVLSPILPE